jgi:mannitol/fructose-specific phosphotransferase system IIA component (Ntr-type)
MAIALADLLDARHVQLAFRSGSAENAIRELVSLLAMNDQLNEPEKFADKIIERERANPSVVEDGVVFPHVRTDLADKIVLAIGRKRAGIAFGNNAEAPANLIFLIGVPQRLIGDYLICVGALARIVRNADIRDQLMKAPTAEEFVEILRTASSEDL